MISKVVHKHVQDSQSSFNYIYLFCMCAQALLHVDVGEELMGDSSVLPLYRSRGIKSGSQAWPQVPLSTDPSHQPPLGSGSFLNFNVGQIVHCLAFTSQLQPLVSGQIITDPQERRATDWEERS